MFLEKKIQSHLMLKKKIEWNRQLDSLLQRENKSKLIDDNT